MLAANDVGDIRARLGEAGICEAVLDVLKWHGTSSADIANMVSRWR
jgi:hypothetical protein